MIVGVLSAVSVMETCGDKRFFFRQAVFFLAQRDALHQESHVAAERAHGLQAFLVLQHFFRRAAVDHVPILAAGHRHSGDGEVFVQHVKGRGVATTAAGDYRCPHLHCYI